MQFLCVTRYVFIYGSKIGMGTIVFRVKCTTQQESENRVGVEDTHDDAQTDIHTESDDTILSSCSALGKIRGGVSAPKISMLLLGRM